MVGWLQCYRLFGGRLPASRLVGDRHLSASLAPIPAVPAAFSRLGSDATLSACFYRCIDIGYRYGVNVFLVTILEQMRCPQRTTPFSQKLTPFRL